MDTGSAADPSRGAPSGGAVQQHSSPSSPPVTVVTDGPAQPHRRHRAAPAPLRAHAVAAHRLRRCSPTLLPVALAWKGLLIVGAVALPWFGVVMANAGPTVQRKRQHGHRRPGRPAVEQPLRLAIDPGRVVDAERRTAPPPEVPQPEKSGRGAAMTTPSSGQGAVTHRTTRTRPDRATRPPWLIPLLAALAVAAGRPAAVAAAARRRRRRELDAARVALDRPPPPAGCRPRRPRPATSRRPRPPPQASSSAAASATASAAAPPPSGARGRRGRSRSTAGTEEVFPLQSPDQDLSGFTGRGRRPQRPGRVGAGRRGLLARDRPRPARLGRDRRDRGRDAVHRARRARRSASPARSSCRTTRATPSGSTSAPTRAATSSPRSRPTSRSAPRTCAPAEPPGQVRRYDAPLTSSTAPVDHAAPSLARNSTACATSSGRADPPGRALRPHPVAARAVEHVRGHVGLDEAGQHAAHRDAVRREGHRQRLAHRGEAGLRGAVRHGAGLAARRSAGADVDDPAGGRARAGAAARRSVTHAGPSRSTSTVRRQCACHCA